MSDYIKLAKLVSDHTGIPMDKIKDTDTPAMLGMDSLDHIELLMKIEDAFNIEITDEKAAANDTIYKMTSLIEALK